MSQKSITIFDEYSIRLDFISHKFSFHDHGQEKVTTIVKTIREETEKNDFGNGFFVKVKWKLKYFFNLCLNIFKVTKL